MTAESDKVSHYLKCPRSQGVAAAGWGPSRWHYTQWMRTSSFGTVITAHEGLASWGWQGFSLKKLIGSFVSQSSACNIVILCTGQVTSYNIFTQECRHWVCCYMQFIVMATASLHFTGRQKPLSFLELRNRGHVSICLLTKQGYKHLTLKKPNKPLKFWKYYLGRCSFKVSLKPSLKAAINFEKNYMIEKSTT